MSQHFNIIEDVSKEQLRRLSNDVTRIAEQLGRLGHSSGFERVDPATLKPEQPGIPQPSPDKLRAMIRSRRLRSSFLPDYLFADPAWDILLDLMHAEILQHRISVSSLCNAAQVPDTTALRWIKTMTDKGLLVRRDDPHDRRRVHISLAPETSLALRQYLATVGYEAI